MLNGACLGAGISAEFEIFPARSGMPTARHIPTGLLIHSAVDPFGEAEALAERERIADAPAMVLLGGGLGYLSDAILRHQPRGTLFIVEPHPELYALARHVSGAPHSAAASGIRVLPAASMAALNRQFGALPKIAAVIVSPYLLRITRGRSGIAQMLYVWRAERASRGIYNSMLSRHESQNSLVIERLPRADGLRLVPTLLNVLTAPGPGLASGLELLRTHRDAITIISVSGAVPILLRSGLQPDWTVALEGREAILADLQDLPAGSRVIVFPATHPQIVANEKWRRFAGQNSAGDGLAARGGSSAIPALDFVLRASMADVALMGLDLGVQHGAYATGAKREAEYPVLPTAPPKFAAMRAGLERVLAAYREQMHYSSRTIYHIIERGRNLSGTIPLEPEQLWEKVAAAI